MIIPPIFGAIQSVRDGLEKRYIASYLALTVVGMGSWCFHMTLKYEMQLLDELPMIYSCCIFVYCMFECFKMKNSVNYHLLFTLVLFSLIVTTVYLKELSKEGATYYRCYHTVSCMVAYFNWPWFLSSHPFQFIYKNTLPEIQAKSEVSLWNLASDPV
uniref:Alkaline ceramidase n=1 Tax=Equus caballus TaxID=9796 RepID=A0A9L0RAK1_HORSE